ncbi:MAG TPA: hypothetical protein VLE44_01225 [Candidatus Saccharimonadales bacterium]|nr:hypothetical protein [Candidatus Saccharimonadales bacterium]
MQELPTVLIVLGSLVILVLAISVVYLVFTYRKLLERYHELTIEDETSDFKNRLRFESEIYSNKLAQKSVDKAIENSVKLISKKGAEIAKDMRKKALEELSIEHKAQEDAVSGEFEEAKLQIGAYKKQKMEAIDAKVNEIIKEVTKDILSKGINEEEHKQLILKALENAKQSNLF